MRARDNPFSTDRVLRVRYRPQGITWHELMGRLADLNYQAALVGPDGSGKTTLLEDLHYRLQTLRFNPRPLFLNQQKCTLTADERRVFDNLGRRDVLLVDGADHLSRFAWLHLRWRARRAGGLVVTSHRTGLLPTLIETRTTPSLMAELLRELIGDEVDQLPVPIDELYARHRGNLREAMRELYDVYADWQVAVRGA